MHVTLINTPRSGERQRHPTTYIFIIAVMSYHTEQDPLLPKDKPAPEIQYSRPQSINDEFTANTRDPDEADRDRAGLKEFGNFLFFVCIFFGLGLGFVFFPDQIFGDEKPHPVKPGPQTIEQRVNTILTNTPLIGMKYYSGHG